MLGRFLHSLNKYCLETHGLNFGISDYSDYNFHKVLLHAPIGLTYKFLSDYKGNLLCLLLSKDAGADLGLHKR